MTRPATGKAAVVATLDIAGLPEGPVLDPMAHPGAAEAAAFAGWETPIAPWGGFRLASGFQIVRDGEACVLEFTLPADERSIVTLPADSRDYAVEARVLPRQEAAGPHNDRADCERAYVGIVFRQESSRRFYLFCVEGGDTLVLYRRSDAEWYPLARQQVGPLTTYVTLRVDLDGDGISCSCPELQVALQATDGTFRTGRAGLRGVGAARVAALRILQTPAQQARDARRRATAASAEAALGADIPEPVLVHRMDLAALGATPLFSDYARPGRYDLLLPGKTLRAVTAAGDFLWEVPFPVRRLEFSREHTPQGRLIYGFTGERSRRSSTVIHGDTVDWIIDDEVVAIEGATGRVLARATLPELDPVLRFPDFSSGSLNLTGTGQDILVREWRRDTGGGGYNLWAYDRDLNLLWHRRVDTPYGHHFSITGYDVDGDGRDEVLAGGRLYDAEGRILWTHDRADEMARIHGAQHYDAAAIGALSGEEDLDPVGFLFGGSAGVYVVDGLSGATRAVHRIGHAQGRVIGRFRDDLPGVQLLAACRWGNMGILTLLSGQGERLWSIQPDYIGQGAAPVTWGKRATQLIWTNTTAQAQAFYDGYGRRVKTLPALGALIAGRMRRDVSASVERIGDSAQDLLTITVDGVLHAFGPGVA